MASTPRADRQPQPPTRLENSLARLHRALQSHARLGEKIDSLFGEWQSRWAGRRDEIVRRLEAIDSHLDTWLPPNAPPRLAVVTAVDETVGSLRDQMDQE